MPPPILLLIPLVLIAVIASIFWRHSRSASMLERWASENGYEILSYERRVFRRGPYLFRTSEHQVVFYVTLRDRTGGMHNAYVRVGGWVFGLLSDKVDVRWDS